MRLRFARMIVAVVIVAVMVVRIAIRMGVAMNGSRGVLVRKFR